ncbi:MAG: hypothetical protein Q8R53_03860 [Nanoarchaeota archaeon]|nr:hypothetical protein [Nanoarchaeota archaeon]
MTKSILRVFRNVQECEQFLNSFPEKAIKKKEVSPFQDDGRASFLVFLEVVEKA